MLLAVGGGRAGVWRGSVRACLSSHFIPSSPLLRSLISSPSLPLSLSPSLPLSLPPSLPLSLSPSLPPSQAPVLQVEITSFAYFNDTVAKQGPATQLTPADGTTYFPSQGDYTAG